MLNFYVPGMLDSWIAMLGTPATSPRVPSREDQYAATRAQREAFDQRLHDLATQALASQEDLLGAYRGDDPPPLP